MRLPSVIVPAAHHFPLVRTFTRQLVLASPGCPTVQVRDFVEKSLLERKLIALTKQADKLAEEREARRAAPSVSLAIKYLPMAVIAVLALLFWGTPIAHVPTGWYTPLGFLLCWSGGPGPHLGIVPWALLCSVLASRAFTALAYGSGLLVPLPQKGLLQSLLGAARPS